MGDLNHTAARVLEEAVTEAGGWLSPVHLAQKVYSRHPEIQAVLSGHLKSFCAEHPRLRFHEDAARPGGGDILLSSSPSGPVQDQRAVQILLAAVDQAGGALAPCDMGRAVYRRYPDLKDTFAGGLKLFCDRHEGLEFRVDPRMRGGGCIKRP